MYEKEKNWFDKLDEGLQVAIFSLCFNTTLCCAVGIALYVCGEWK